MSIVRPYLYLLPKEQSRNWTLEHWNTGTLEHWNTLVQSQNWGIYLEVWQLDKSQPCSTIQFFALSTPMLTNSGVGNGTDPRYHSISIKLTKVPYWPNTAPCCAQQTSATKQAHSELQAGSKWAPIGLQSGTKRTPSGIQVGSKSPMTL